MPEPEPVRINAKSFQEPLSDLTQTMVQKIFREGVRLPPRLTQTVKTQLTVR